VFSGVLMSYTRSFLLCAFVAFTSNVRAADVIDDSLRLRLNFDAAPVPQPNLSQNPVNFANYWAQGVSKQSKNSDWAWDFVKFMASKDQQTKYFARHKLPSGRRDILSDQIADPVIGTFAFENLTAKSFYKKDQIKIDNIILSMIDDVTVRGKSISDVISNAAQQIDLLSVQQ